MSTHPNVILMVKLTPDDLSRKTMRDILGAFDASEDDEIRIGDEEYTPLIMESDYDEGWQIAAKEGDLVFFDTVTYGYGEVIAWEKLQMQKESLEKWAKTVCEQFHCTYEIALTANYW